MIEGFKAFNIDKTNDYGYSFEEGKTYSLNGDIIFGNNGNGFHFCANLEDTLKFFNSFKREITIAKVHTNNVGDDIVEFEDEYDGFYDMYACREITIENFLSRKEIIEEMLKCNDLRQKRFVSLFKMTEKEYRLFENKHRLVDDSIEYYQKGNTEIYSLRRMYGKHSNKGS